MINGLFQKKPTQGSLRTYCFEKKNSEVFRFVNLRFTILYKIKLYPCRFCEFVLHPLEIPRPKMRTYGNST